MTGAAVAAVLFVLAKLTGHIATRAQRPVLRQAPQPAPALAAAPAPVPAGASPAVHVHVHLDRPLPAPVPALASPPPDPSGNKPPAAVLGHPDHRIYITTGSHLMMEHPAGKDLLDQLDEILYRASFRDGDPFTVAPPGDDSRKGAMTLLDLPPLAAVDEEEFFSADRQPLPPPDGVLWLCKAGQAPLRLAPGSPS